MGPPGEGHVTRTTIFLFGIWHFFFVRVTDKKNGISTLWFFSHAERVSKSSFNLSVLTCYSKKTLEDM